MLKNTAKTYSPVTRILHWTISLFIICLIAVGFYMNSLPPSDIKWKIFDLHKATGTLVLTLVTLRVIWRFMNVWPRVPSSTPRWQEIIANINIFALYCLILIMPLSGFFGSLIGGYSISFYELFTIPAISDNKEICKYLFEIHEISAYILVFAVALHFGAAIYHHFILKDNVLKRMIKGS